MKRLHHIPDIFTVGGQKVEIRNVERCDNNAYGISFLGAGYIEIADNVNKNDKQSMSSKDNTFFHELTHCILDTMGQSDLSKDEVFVSSFAGFLTEAMTSAEYKVAD